MAVDPASPDDAASPGGPMPVPTADRLARAWARAVADTSFVPMDRSALVTFLRGLAADLLAAYTAAEGM